MEPLEPAVRVSAVEFRSAYFADRRTGLLGWVSFCLDGAVLIRGVAVRVTVDGRRRLSFPEPTDSGGRRHRPVRPLDDAARRAIEAQVFAALDAQGVAP
jgi:hypothetical protein